MAALVPRLLGGRIAPPLTRGAATGAAWSAGKLSTMAATAGAAAAATAANGGAVSPLVYP